MKITHPSMWFMNTTFPKDTEAEYIDSIQIHVKTATGMDEAFWGNRDDYSCRGGSR